MKRHGSGAARAQRGETLAEVLVALLIVTLATLLLASMVTASGGINLAARQKDERFYEALSKVESLETGTAVDDTADGTPDEFQVEIKPDPAAVGETGKKVEVNVYTSEGLTLYRRKQP